MRLDKLLAEIRFGPVLQRARVASFLGGRAAAADLLPGLAEHRVLLGLYRGHRCGITGRLLVPHLESIRRRSHTLREQRKRGGFFCVKEENLNLRFIDLDSIFIRPPL